MSRLTSFYEQLKDRRVILLGLVGIPVVLIYSWFFEGSWHRRRLPAVLGDDLPPSVTNMRAKAN